MTTQFDAKAIEDASKAANTPPPALYGRDEHIASLVRRMRYMMPGGATAPDVVIWRAAQLCALHNLDPFGTGDIYIWSPYGENTTDPKKWIIHVGIAAWRRKAQDQAKYNLKPRPMPPEEVQHYRGDLYHPDDCGCEMTLWRLDVAEKCLKLGIPYAPIVTQGFWRVNAYKIEKTGAYSPDSLANTETKADKARKRAEARALKIAFSLSLPTEEDQLAEETQWQIIDNLEYKVKQEEIFRMPVADRIDYTQPDWDIFMQ